ncbi:MAG: B-box zinc finger protein [Promethearchaeia archaeon]
MSEQNIQICRFCQRNIKLAYYCEDCGTSCCSDCLHEEKYDFYVCQDCNSKNIEILDSGKKKVCKNCRSENVKLVNQQLKSCPKCHSHQIINIYEKKEQLEKKFLDLIKNARTFIDPLRDALNNLYTLRQKIERARDSPIRCHHYPNMESDLLSLFKLFGYAKENLLEKIGILFHHFSLNKEYFFNIYNQPNSNVKIIEGIFENLNTNYHSINEFITNNLITITNSVEPIQKNLYFIDKINYIFDSYKKYLNLADKEKAVYAVYAKLANGLNNHDKFKKNKGILFITNFDLSFVQMYGRIKKKQKTIFKAPVKDLTRIKLRGKLFKKLYVEFDYGRYEFTLPPKVLTKVMDYILLARNFDECVIYDEDSAKNLYKIDIDFSDLINYIEEAINSFFSLKCKYNTINQSNAINYQNKNNNLLIQNPYNPVKQVQFNSIQNENRYPQNFDFYQNPAILPPGAYKNYNPNFQNNSPYQNNLYPYNLRNTQIQTPGDMRYYGTAVRQYLPPNYNENDFFLQNFYDPNRIQNYRSERFDEPYIRNIPDLEDKNILMRKLEQMQRINPPILNPPDKYNYDFNNELFMELNNRRHEQSRMPIYHEYSKNHLSDLFNSDYTLSHENYMQKKKISKLETIKRKEMLELEKEKYSLEETLKTLDSKFDKGIISEIDYFRTFKNLQKEIYLIDRKIENLEEEISESESLRRSNREFDKKRYFS